MTEHSEKDAFLLPMVLLTLCPQSLERLWTEVTSKECRLCTQWRGKERSLEFHEWWKGHRHECHANFEGCSGSMDVSGILNIFQRSFETHSMRYVEFLGDKESKVDKLLAEDDYGNVAIKKLECVGQIQKRLRSCLCSLKGD